MGRTVPWIAIVALVCACAAGRSEREFDGAVRAARQERLDEAVDRLHAALEAGYEHPSRILRMPEFDALRRSRPHRRALFDLMQRHVPETEIVMIADGEPGRRFVLRGAIVDGSSGEPIEGAGLQIVHVDNEGNYSESLEDWNPRLFGFVSTGADGRFSVRTIRPPSYPDGTGALSPAHFHFLAWADGYRLLGGEILFEDDPVLDEARRREAERNGSPIVRPEAGQNGVQGAEARIALTPLASRARAAR